MKLPRSLWLISVVGAELLAAACAPPGDELFEPPGFTPLQDRDGRYRVTFGSGPDAVRGFLPDGRLLFRTFDLVPFGEAWILASAPLEGGVVREEAAVYRPALRSEMGSLLVDEARRILAAWIPALPGVDGCPDSSLTSAGIPPPPTPSPVGVTLYTLPPADGPPLASFPARFIPMTTVTGAGTISQRVRVSPAVSDADRDGANPFGPVLLSGSTQLIFSDGEQLWQASVTDTSAAPVSIGAGAYPAISADRRTLAYARPLGLDSTVRNYFVPVGIVVCNERHVEVTAASWEIVLRDLESGTESVLGEGRDPAFDPVASRLVVRGSGLQWLELSTGVPSPIPATTGAFAPALSPDGAKLAFSLINAETEVDVYFIRLTR